MNYQRNVYYSTIAPYKPRWYVGKKQKQVNKMLAQLLVEAEAEENIGFDAEGIPVDPPLPLRPWHIITLGVLFLSFGLIYNLFAR